MKQSQDPPPPYSSEAGESTPLLPPPTYQPQPQLQTFPPFHPQRTRKGRRRVILLLNLLAWILVSLIVATLVKHFFFTIPLDVPVEEQRVRIAVVGAGPAGISTAYTLSNELKGKGKKDGGVEIVLFEQKERVGGRMILGDGFGGQGLGRKAHAEDIAGSSLGGDVLMEQARALGVEWKQGEGEKGGKEVGFFDGREFVSKTTRPVGEMGWGMWLRFVLRYKLDVWRAKELPKGTMRDFGKVLNGKGTLESVSEMVEHAGIGGAVGMGARERLRMNGFGGRYVDEVLTPQLWRQTAQGVGELSDLGMSMALEREEQVSGGGSGGFENVMEKFVERSGAKLSLGTKVIGLEREVLADGKEAWRLEIKGAGNEEKTYEVFDKVILAGPWKTSSFLSDENREEEEVYYRSLWVTFFLSSQTLNGEYFGSSDNIPSQILPIPSANLPSELYGIHEIAYVADIFGPDIRTQSVRKLYRILSNQSISNEVTSAFSEDGELKSYERIEHAYPLMWPRKGNLGKFKIQEGLWHTGIVEGIGSSVDLSWVTGENVGRLVAREVVKRR